MIPENNYLAVFAKHKHYYDMFAASGEVVNFNHDVQDELLEAYRGLFDEYYNYSRTCKVCVIEFLMLAYRKYLNKIA